MINPFRLSRLAALVTTLAVATPAARAQTVTFTTGTPFLAPGLTTFSTTGSMLVGTKVTARFSDGTVRVGTWGGLPGGLLFGVIDAGFYTLAVDGFVPSGTFNATNGGNLSSLWTLFALAPNAVLTSLTLNGAPGRTLFDCQFLRGVCRSDLAVNDLGDEGTPGSAGGANLTFAGSHDFFDFNTTNLSVEYANVVGLGGLPPVGDLFEQVTLTFKGLARNQFFKFDIDTDSSIPTALPPAPATDLPATSVPEPGTYALMAAGLLALAAVRRTRRVTSA